MVALSGFVQNIVWNTWVPIAQSAKEVFGWSDGQIGMLPNFANIAYIVTVFPASYFTQTLAKATISGYKQLFFYLAMNAKVAHFPPLCK
jgi:hypothetical protein